MTTSPTEWCGASTRGFGAVLIGPCVLRCGHDGPLHLDEAGVSWTDPRPASESTEPLCPPALRDRLADAIRSTVRISAGPRALDELNAGRSIAISGGEADDAALAVLPVVEAWAAEQTQRAEQAEQDAKRERALRQWGDTTSDGFLTRLHEAEAAVQRVREFAEDMRTWCSPYGVAADYAKRLLAALDRPEGT